MSFVVLSYGQDEFCRRSIDHVGRDALAAMRRAAINLLERRPQSGRLCAHTNCLVVLYSIMR